MPAWLNWMWRLLAFSFLVTAAATHAYAAAPSDIAAGQQIAFSRKLGNCIACHSLPGAAMPGNVGPRLGPWLKHVFRTKAALEKYLYDPPAKFPHVVMPEFGKNGLLTDKQIQQVADYLWSLKE